ncbi:MAG: tRNA (N6-threonylcarbamoyladenosine(37)-N6)-methyltransferase TrmO [Coriobacteriales bacterium]|jgi:tRNA-Thr(GGU) m(6)t(6)A37 methyltransferase TsaA
MRGAAVEISPIAHIRSPFPEKFGIPRQSGLVEDVVSEVVFEPEYRDPNALRGIEGFDYLWLIWGFSCARRGGEEGHDEDFVSLVRPPRLGGNERMGVFASRSPFRPNHLALSSVKLVDVVKTKGRGTVLEVSGADLMDGTPIYDVKPYIPYTDSHPQAAGGFAADPDAGLLEVSCPKEFLDELGDEADGLIAVLARDPRPAYHHDPTRVYGMRFSSWTVRFCVADGILTVEQLVREE